MAAVAGLVQAETGSTEDAGGIAGELAAAGQVLPGRVHAFLQALHPPTFAEYMLQCQQGAAGFEYPEGLCGGPLRIRDGAEYQAGDHGIEVVIRVGKLLGITGAQHKPLRPRTLAGRFLRQR